MLWMLRRTVWTHIRQAQQNVRPDLDPNSLSLFDTLMVFLKEFFKKDDFEKNQQMTKLMKKLSSMQRVKATNCKVNLRIIVGDFTHAVLFMGLCHVLSHCCIGQLYTIR